MSNKSRETATSALKSDVFSPIIPSMKINKALFILPLIILCILALAILYFQNIFLPIKLKEIVSQRSKELINRELSVGQVDYSFLKGFILKNVKLFEKNDPRKDFITAEEVSFQVLLPALFKNQKIIIPSISIKNPYVSVIRHTDKSFNFSDIIEKFNGASSGSSAPILLGGFSLTGGQINFTGQKNDGELRKALQNIHAKANLSVKGSVDFSVGGRIRENTEPFPAFTAQGKYHFADKKLTLKTNISAMPSRYIRLFLPDEQTIRFEFQIKTAGLSLTLNKTELSVSGAMDINSPEFHLAQESIFANHFTAAHFQLQKMEDKWRISGDWSGTDAYFKNHNQKYQRFDISASSFIFERDNANTKIQGNFVLKDINVDLGYKVAGEFEARGLRANVDGRDFDLTAALFSKKIHLKYRDTVFDGTIESPDTHIVFKDRAVHLEGRYATARAFIDLQEKFQITGAWASRVSLRTSPDAPAVYQGEVDFQRTSIKGIPHIDNLTNVQGRTNFSNDKAETQRLSFDTLGSSFTISGTARDFKDPQMDVRFNSNNVDLKKIFALVSLFNKDLKLSPSGSASIEGRFRGRTSAAKNGRLNIKAVLKNASLEGPPLPFPISNMTGTVSGDNKKFIFENLKGTVQKNDYTLNGTLNDLKNPALNITLVSSSINLTSQLKIANDPAAPSVKIIAISSLRGYYLNTPLDVQGSIALKNGTRQLNLEGHTDLELADLSALLPQLAEKIKPLNPGGLLKTNFTLRGPADNWTDWDVSIDSQSERLLLWGLKFEGVGLRFTQRDKKITDCSITSKLYAGDLNISSSADLDDDDLPFDLTLSLENTDLEKLKNDTGLKNRPLSGKIFSSLNLSGHLQDGSGLSGEGTLSVKEGNLAQMTIFKGLINALLPKEFQSVNFTSGTMGFEVRERKVSTSNLTLFSEQVTLAGRGSIDFDQNIKFLIEPKFSEIALTESQSLRTPVASVMNIANQFVDMEMTGTLSKPVFTPKPRPGKVLNKVKDALIDGLENIFQ